MRMPRAPAVAVPHDLIGRSMLMRMLVRVVMPGMMMVVMVMMRVGMP